MSNSRLTPKGHVGRRPAPRAEVAPGPDQAQVSSRSTTNGRVEKETRPSTSSSTTRGPRRDRLRPGVASLSIRLRPAAAPSPAPIPTCALRDAVSLQKLSLFWPRGSRPGPNVSRAHPPEQPVPPGSCLDLSSGLLPPLVRTVPCPSSASLFLHAPAWACGAPARGARGRCVDVRRIIKMARAPWARPANAKQ